MSYRTVFDASEQYLHGWVATIAMCAILLAVASIILQPSFLIRSFPQSSPGKYARNAVRTVWLAIVAIFIAIELNYAFKGRYVLEEQAAAQLRGEFPTIEGRVEQFQPMPYQGDKDEFFTVKGVTFRYSDYYINGGFKNTSSHGGPMREGLFVRITYKTISGSENVILKLEIRDY